MALFFFLRRKRKATSGKEKEVRVALQPLKQLARDVLHLGSSNLPLGVLWFSPLGLARKTLYIVE